MATIQVHDPGLSMSRLWAACVALVVAGFAVTAFGLLRLANDPAWQDTEAYLGHSLYIAEHGGWIGFLSECFRGAFPIAERHPLYMLLLAPFASRTAEFFWNAKLFDLVCGLLLLLTVAWMAWRRFGRGPALLAAILFAASGSLLAASSHVDHETQFALACLWAWWFLTVTRGADPVDGMPGRTGAWVLAGLCLGIAYLTKSSVALFGVGIVVAAVWHAGWRPFADRRLWALVLAGAVVSSPLLVRNIVGFGTPVYEGQNSSIMWLDQWSDLGGEHSVMYYDQYGIVHVEQNGMPTASEYFATHGPVQVAKRLAKGLLVQEPRVARDALAPPPELAPSLLRQAWGWGVLLLVAAGLWRHRRSWGVHLTLAWSAVFFVFFGWDFMFPDIRYLAPLIPLWLIYAADAGWHGLRRLGGMHDAARWVLVGAATVAIVGVGATAASGMLTRPFAVLGGSDASLRLVDWMNRSMAPGSRLLLGPTMEFYGKLWLVDQPVSVIQTPNAGSLDAFDRYLRDRNVRYIVMHPENARGLGGRLEAALRPYLAVDPSGAVVEKKILPGWRHVHRDSGVPSRFIVYEREGFVDPRRS